MKLEMDEDVGRRLRPCFLAPEQFFSRFAKSRGGFIHQNAGITDVYDVDFFDASVVSAARAPVDGPHRPALVSLRRVSNEHMVITRLDE